MNSEEIKKYAALMKELELTGLEIKEGNSAVRLERSVTVPKEQVIVREQEASEQKPAQGEKKSKSDGCVSVKSPIVGVFYAAPAENADPYVAIGSRVEKGQILCIIEAMKMLNEIPADCDGVIEKICVANGQVVEYGTELFRIRRA